MFSPTLSLDANGENVQFFDEDGVFQSIPTLLGARRAKAAKGRSRSKKKAAKRPVKLVPRFESPRKKRIGVERDKPRLNAPVTPKALMAFLALACVRSIQTKKRAVCFLRDTFRVQYSTAAGWLAAARASGLALRLRGRGWTVKHRESWDVTCGLDACVYLFYIFSRALALRAVETASTRVDRGIEVERLPFPVLTERLLDEMNCELLRRRGYFHCRRKQLPGPMTLAMVAAAVSIHDENGQVKTFSVFCREMAKVMGVPISQLAVTRLTLRFLDVSTREEELSPLAGQALTLRIEQVDKVRHLPSWRKVLRGTSTKPSHSTPIAKEARDNVIHAAFGASSDKEKVVTDESRSTLAEATDVVRSIPADKLRDELEQTDGLARALVADRVRSELARMVGPSMAVQMEISSGTDPLGRMDGARRLVKRYVERRAEMSDDLTYLPGSTELRRIRKGYVYFKDMPLGNALVEPYIDWLFEKVPSFTKDRCPYPYPNMIGAEKLVKWFMDERENRCPMNRHELEKKMHAGGVPSSVTIRHAVAAYVAYLDSDRLTQKDNVTWLCPRFLAAAKWLDRNLHLVRCRLTTDDPSREDNEENLFSAGLWATINRAVAQDRRRRVARRRKQART